MRVTGPLLLVLRALVEADGQECYGLELLRSTGLKSGTLYPILDRLLENEMVSARWEEADNPVGPRRRFYRLTSFGLHEAHQILLSHGIGGRFAWGT